ncbi:MAG: hypothetical protein J6U14_10130 [Bacteroidaceae bacterium]|nr:hypothetical protein [Bacteroidaceae bacterium]
MNDKKNAMKQTIIQIGHLVERYLKETGTRISSLTEETSVHYNTFKKVISGDPEVRVWEALLVIAELMQRDTSRDLATTQRFFDELRALLDDAFDNC